MDLIKKFDFEEVSVHDELGIPRTFFSVALKTPFTMDVLRALSEGVNYGKDVVFCRFPWGLDEGEEKFEGVKFEFYEDYEIIDYRTFSSLAIRACEVHSQNHLKDRVKVEEFKVRFQNFDSVVKYRQE